MTTSNGKAMKVKTLAWFRDVIRDPKFVETHLQRSKPGLIIQNRVRPCSACFLEFKENGDFEFTNMNLGYPGEFLSSCKGVAVFSGPCIRFIYVANPIIMVVVQAPTLLCDCLGRGRPFTTYSAGFGYGIHVLKDVHLGKWELYHKVFLSPSDWGEKWLIVEFIACIDQELIFSKRFCDVPEKYHTYNLRTRRLRSLGSRVTQHEVVLNAAWDVSILVASENALPCYDREGYNKMLENAKPQNDPDDRHLSAFTYLRLSPVLMETHVLCEVRKICQKDTWYNITFSFLIYSIILRKS
ncbi:hypothetical protein REPUB_Repub12eG0181300 [Reevesia pubescens]